MVFLGPHGGHSGLGPDWIGLGSGGLEDDDPSCSTEETMHLNIPSHEIFGC